MKTEDMITILTEEAMGQESQFLLDVVARLRELHEATQGRPISEAPKDGTYVLLFDRESMVIPIIGSWEPRSVGRGKAWHDVSLNDIEEEHGFIPTHFMPLPKGPEVTR